MEESVQRLIGFAGAVVLVASSLMLFAPWLRVAGYRLDYLRQAAVEIAYAIESKSSVRLVENFYAQNRSIVVEVVKPRETPVRIQTAYSIVITALPVHVEEVVRGRPEASFSRFREACVYMNGTHLIVEPKPLVRYHRGVEYGRRVHIVEVTLFIVSGELSKGSVLTFNSSYSYVYVRTYDYRGTASVTVSGEDAVSFTVRGGEVLKIFITYERWTAG